MIISRDIATLLNKTYPLWTGSTAVDAAVVLVCLCDLTQLGAGLRVYLPHFAHLDCVVCGLLSVVGMQGRGIMGEGAVEMSLVSGEKRRAGLLVGGMLLLYVVVMLSRGIFVDVLANEE